MQKVKKDNLTDLVGDITKPQEASPAKPSEGKEPNPQPKPLDDYQVTTPDGEVIDMDITLLKPMVQKTNRGIFVKKIQGGKDKKGNQYVLIVDEVAS